MQVMSNETMIQAYENMLWQVRHERAQLHARDTNLAARERELETMIEEYRDADTVTEEVPDRRVGDQAGRSYHAVRS